jgi:uncharacterized protein (TIGR03437 family)
MDAAYNSLKKTVLFVVATALLLAAPICANAQPSIVFSPTLGVGGTIQIGNAGCNQYQILQLTSTGSAIGIQVSVVYKNAGGGLDPVNGNWLYATVSNAALAANNGTTAPVLGGSTNSAFNTLVPVSTNTAGINLQIGLNRNFVSPTEQASVLLHVTDSSGASDITITVNYVQSSSCGGNTGSLTNGFITISPASLTMTAAQGSSQMLSLQIQNNTPSALNFSAATPAGDTWLSTNASLSAVLAGNATTTVNVTANATGLNVNVNPYSSHVTITSSAGAVLVIPVSFAVTAGTGTGGSGTLTLDGGTVASRSFQYIASGSSATGIPGPSCINISDSNSSITNYSDSFTTNAGGNWLTVNNSAFSPQSNQSFSANCLQVQANNSVLSLASGVYTGSVVVTDSTGSTATANITLYVTAGSPTGVTASPGVIFSFPGVVTGATATESQQFTVSAVSPITLGTAVQSSALWLNTTAPTGVGTGTEQFTVTAYPSGLAAGIYSATITVPSANPVGSTTILVSLAVGQSTGQGGGTVTSTVVPTSLTFASMFGNTNWSGGSEAQTITITGASGTSWSSSVAYGSGGTNWLRFGGSSGVTGGTFGSAPAALTVDIQPSNLAASTTAYTAVVTVTTPSGTTNVNVSLLVTAAGNNVLLASPASALFTYNGGANPASQQVVFSDTTQGFPGNPGQAAPSIAVTTPTTWLVATSIGNTLTLTANATGLATGAYGGSVAVTSSAYPNSPFTYPVVFVVNGGTSTGPLTLSTSGLTFNATASGNLPASQALTVTATNQTNASVSVSEQNCTNFTWLTIAPSGSFLASTSNSNFSVSVNQSGIQAGSTCSGTVTFTTSSTSQTVSVSMVVGSSSTGGNVTVTPSTLQPFSFTIGGSNPATQTLAIANATTSTSGISFTVTSSASWLTTNATSAVSTPYNLVVTANPSGLAASATAYAATLTIQPSGGTAVVVNVTFAIAGVPVVSATPTTLSFTYSVGSSNPPTQTVHVSGGGAAATFTATPSSSGWLQLSATAGTTPNTGTFDITVTANPLNLNPGQTYNGSITISGTGTATGSTIVNVTFAVSAPIPTITKVTNAASYATGAVSPGEVISIFANASNPIGPTPYVQLSSANCPSPCTNVPTTMGGVQVKFLPQGILAPLLYVSATQINAVVPYEVQTAGANLSVEVVYLTQASNAFVLQVAATAPGIISSNGSGTGTAAMNQYDAAGNYQGINSGSNPASPGWVLVLYVTGEGSIPSAVTGSVTSAINVKPLIGAPTVLVDQLPATVQYYGEATGIVSGVMQINVQIPTGIRTSQADGISFTIGGNTSQSGVTVQIR